MNLYIFSVFDVKADAYIPPFFLPQKAMALRAFTDCVNSPTHQFGANPHDYTLFLLGSYDDATGLFDTHEPRTLGNGLEFIKTVPDADEVAEVRSPAKPIAIYGGKK